MLHYCATDCSYKKAKLSVPGLSKFGITKPATGVGITPPKRRTRKKKKEKLTEIFYMVGKANNSKTAFFMPLVFCCQTSPYF